MAEKSATHGASGPPLSVVELSCPLCGETGMHRVLHVRPFRAPRDKPGGGVPSLEGVARCPSCRGTHPFRVTSTPQVRVRGVLSEGSRSHPFWVERPLGTRFELGESLKVDGRPLRIVRLELNTGASAELAKAESIRALWTIPDDRIWVRLSWPRGAKTLALRHEVDANAHLAVDDLIHVEGKRLVIVGLRVGMKTYDRPGSGAAARDVTRVYVRRAETPPVGRRDWMRSRETPRSRASSFSSSSRSRSSPGLRVQRMRDPARENDDGGAD